MMNDQPALVTHHAILIGINTDADKGCVRDVLEIENYLRQEHSSWMPKPPQILKFTASLTGNSDSSRPVRDSQSPSLSESLELRPTYDNVTAGLKGILSRAKAGDFLYIHYSGHGTRIQPSNDFSGSSKGDLALVLLKGPTGTDSHYLEGLELASYLKDMVGKGLTVTLVLDCCFSGSVMRNDSSTPFLSYEPKVHAAYNPTVASSLQTKIKHSNLRDNSMEPNWLVNPDGYTILAACGPTEKALELDFGNAQIRGALSYFLLRGLQKLENVRETQQLIYHYLRAKFRENEMKHDMKQNPNLYGNNTLSFFGPPSSGIRSAPVFIVKKPDDSPQLEAGQAHGLSNGDWFTVFPWSSTEQESFSQRGPVIAKITLARALVSDLELIDASVDVQTGWTATLQTCCSIQASLIRLDPDLPQQNEWLKAFNDRSLGIATNQSGESVPFHLRVSSESEYEILNESGLKLDNLPIMKKDQTDIHLICDTVAHLAKFNMVRDLTNRKPAKSFLESFSVHINSLEPGSLIKVKQDERLNLEMKNKGDTNLYFYIFNMGPHWQIENILRANHKVIAPGENYGSKLKMTIPPEWPEKGRCQCNDIIKIFITAQLTSFDMLELPKLGSSDTNIPVNGNTAQNGNLPPEDRATLKPVDGNRGQNGNSSSEDWAALNFNIHIQYSQEALDATSLDHADQAGRRKEAELE